MSAPRFVFFGAQGEYVLTPLYQEMQARGHDCVEIVAMEGRDAAAEVAALPDHAGPTVLISCAHVMHDAASMLEFLGIPNCPPFLEVKQRLDPALTVYYTHDLSSPFIWDEQQCAAAFDLYLAATV